MTCKSNLIYVTSVTVNQELISKFEKINKQTMKKAIGLIIAVVMISSCSEAQEKTISGTVQTTEASIRVAVAEEFNQIMKKEKVQLLDVRTKKEYDKGHIGNAENFDFYSDDFRIMLSKLDKNKITLIYCHSGGRSGKARAIMANMGFMDVVDLKGGFSAWPF